MHAKMQAAVPATPRQVGAIHCEFRRLGFARRDRADRLAVSAALLGLEGLGSTRDLVMGDAGRLIRQLRGMTGRADVETLMRARPGPAVSSDTWADLILIAVIVWAFVPRRGSWEP